MATESPQSDPLLDLSGDLEDLPVDLSENFDYYLDLTYGPRTPTPLTE